MKILAIVAFLAASQAASAMETHVVHGMAPTMGGEVVQRQAAIRTDDVNMADAAGAAIVLARIKLAADAVCSGGSGAKSEFFASKVAKCRDKAVAQAVREIGVPAVAAAAVASAK